MDLLGTPRPHKPHAELLENDCIATKAFKCPYLQCRKSFSRRSDLQRYV